jgi:alanyl-tRNA synthetase
VSLGTNPDGSNAGRVFSIELCGGTHVGRTGDIGLVAVLSENAVAAGVRRIEAKTATGARHHLAGEARKLRDAASLLKAPAEELSERLIQLVEERRRLERDLTDARKKLAMGGGAGSQSDALQDIGGIKLFARTVTGIEMKDLKSLADQAKQQVGSGIVAIVGVAADGKAGVVVGVTKDLTDQFSAVDLVRTASEALGGKGGGGRADMAQAGGPDGAQAQSALTAIAAALKKKAAA